MKEKKISKKTIIKRIILILSIIFTVFIVVNILPFIIFVVLILWSMFFDIPVKPKETHGEFPFKLVYEYKGEQVTIEDTITCDYDGYSFSLEGGNSRDWTCEFGKDEEYGYYYIDKENLPDLYIVIPDSPEYYMGSKEASKEYSEPYIHYIDESTGTYYEEKEKIDIIDIEIVEWNPSEPLKDNIK